GTLRIQRPPDQWGHTVSMDTNPVDPADEPGRFTYAELLDLGDPSALLHLVLPPNYLPQAGTIRPFPTYARPDGDRLVMGWVWRPGVWTRFQFGPLAPAQFGAAANRVRRRVTQGQQAALESEQELQSIETQLRIWYGNRRLLEEQKAQFGLEIPLRLHNELANANAQIEALAARRAAVTGQYGAG
ncbi:MAG: hypothetical protein ACE5G8_18140, partial [Anaerolineae bacterium]